MKELEFNSKALVNEEGGALLKFVAYLEKPQDPPLYFQVEIYDKKTDRSLTFALSQKFSIKLANFINSQFGQECPRCKYQEENQLGLL